MDTRYGQWLWFGLLVSLLLGGCQAYSDFSHTLGKTVAPNAYNLCQTPQGLTPCAR